MKESHTGIGICRCYQCRMKKKNCSTSGRKSLKRAINKFRRKQLKLDKVTRHNHFGGYCDARLDKSYQRQAIWHK